MAKTPRSEWNIEGLTLAADAAPVLLTDDWLAVNDEISLLLDAEAPEVADFAAIDIEQVAAVEANAILDAFAARGSREEQRFLDATDSEYWVALCFQTREQKEEFLHKIGWANLGDKYLDGMLCAEASQIRLTSRLPAVPKLRTDRRLTELAL
jgi:hypothetical protein